MLGRQLVVHVAYTVSMPRALEEFVVKAGARIQTEIAHAHARLVVVVDLEDPVDAVLGVRAIAEPHGVRFTMRCFEALSDAGDPLAQLR